VSLQFICILVANIPSKFQPYVDQDLQKNAPPTTARQPLATKAAITPSPPAQAPADENAGIPSRPSSGRLVSSSSSGETSNNNKPGAVFSKVFTPAPSHTEESQRQQPFRPLTGAKGTTFTPLRDSKQLSSFKVFSRPTAQDENTPMARSTFKPYVDGGTRFENRNLPQRSSSKGILSSNAPLREDEDEEFEEDEEALNTAGPNSDDEAGYNSDEQRTPEVENDDENPGSYRGRFGRTDVDIMTPIAERTFEVTTTSTLPAAPSFRMQDATAAAMQLAAELRKEEEREDFHEPTGYDPVYAPEYPDDEDESEEESHFTTDDPVGQDLEGRTGTLSLMEAVTVASSFRPPNPCIPFEPSITSTLLSLAPPSSGFHDHMHEEANQLALLQKFCKKQERRGSNSTTNAFFNVFPLTLGDRQYDIVDKLGEGGFGAVFAAKDVALTEDDADTDVDPMVAIKVVRPKNLWEFCVLQNLRSSLPADLRSSIIEPHALFAFRDESFLLLDMCSQGTLLELVNRVHEINIGQKGACLDELLVIFFTIELLRLVEGIHTQGFIHGDLKIDNCLLRLEPVPGGSSAWSSAYQPSGSNGWSHKGIKLIDFGRTIDTRQFPKDQQFVADWPTDERDCEEMRNGAPWTYQPDYFGLAGIVYCMLYGKYFDEHSVVSVTSSGGDTPPRYKLSVSFKRYWQVDLWAELFEMLLNPTLARPDGQLPLCAELRSIRGKFEDWLQRNDRGIPSSLQGLLKKVTIASERG
jgi:checkpoint serine/threonine-protein kinase